MQPCDKEWMDWHAKEFASTGGVCGAPDCPLCCSLDGEMNDEDYRPNQPISGCPHLHVFCAYQDDPPFCEDCGQEL